MRKTLILMFIAFCSVCTFAQADRQYIRNGNRLYRQQNFVKAEAEYRKSLSANSDNAQAMYNLGCALLMQGKDSAAVEQFDKAGRVEKGTFRKAKIYHNIGFTCQSHRMYGEAIKAYKESLRNNPEDDETRYNLALCKRLNKSNKDKNNRNRDKSKDKKQNNNKDKKQNKDQKQDNKQKEEQQQKQQMSKDNAEQLLNAAMQNEQSTRQRIKDAMRQNGSRKLQKNW